VGDGDDGSGGHGEFHEVDGAIGAIGFGGLHEVSALQGAANVPLGVAIAPYATPVPTSNRWIKSPAPGGPSANVEKSRCTCIPFSAYGSGNGFETFHSADAAPHFGGLRSR
jgi:hypothetical protein